jgi:spore maturation protein CgeB
MPGKISILYVGSLSEQSNSFRRFKTLAGLGHNIEGIDIDPLIYKSRFSRFHHHFNAGPGIYKINRLIIDKIVEIKPDLLLVDNKPFITSRTLNIIRKLQPSIKIVNLITDDPTGRYKYAWRLCLSTAKLYDFHFVQRKVNVQELLNAGARKVELCYRSFDPTFHRPIQLQQEDQKKYESNVGFIGTYEDVREEYVAYLIENKIPVSVTGDGWSKGKNWKLIEPYYNGPSIYGEAYIKTINGMKIALHFLRHANRDEQDSRTFEIPACGVFMLGESSDLHRMLFNENEEAVFFTTKEELLNKVQYYLLHDEERKRIARNGRERCIKSGYDHTSRLNQVIEVVFKEVV